MAGDAVHVRVIDTVSGELIVGRDQLNTVERLKMRSGSSVPPAGVATKPPISSISDIQKYLPHDDPFFVSQNGELRKFNNTPLPLSRKTTALNASNKGSAGMLICVATQEVSLPECRECQKLKSSSGSRWQAIAVAALSAIPLLSAAFLQGRALTLVEDIILTCSLAAWSLSALPP